MAAKLKTGDRVQWNSDAAQVSCAITKVFVRDFGYKGHTHRATVGDPHDEIRNDKRARVAAHKGVALRGVE